jgi:adenine phosphoribosyltransferase
VDLIRNAIRDIPDFPKPGILFKDITPLLHKPELGPVIVNGFLERLGSHRPDAVLGIESRGFLFGYALAQALKVPFVPVRKSGKLPAKTIGIEYALEYGTARIEMHADALQPGMNVLVHDDLLATGGTAAAAAALAKQLGATISGFAFIVELEFLNGREPLLPFSKTIHSLVSY